MTKTVKAIGYQVGGGGTKVNLTGSELMSQASGEAKVEAKAGATNVEASVKGLAQATTLDANLSGGTGTETGRRHFGGNGSGQSGGW